MSTKEVIGKGAYCLVLAVGICMACLGLYATHIHQTSEGVSIFGASVSMIAWAMCALQEDNSDKSSKEISERLDTIISELRELREAMGATTNADQNQKG